MAKKNSDKDIINKIIRNESLDADEIVTKINEILNTKQLPETPKEHEDAKIFNDLL